MSGRALRALAVVVAVAAGAAVSSAEAAQCGDTPEGFKVWLDDFKQVAINDGVSPGVVDEAFANAKFDPSVLSHDRSQSGLQGGDASFAARHISPARVKQGKSMMLAYAEPLQRIEARFGVPAPVLVAIWGLETDYGASLGRYSTFSALATLAYDCRRGSLYQAELIDALMIVERGLLSPSQMRGAWAGELGQTQFMPSAYLKYGVSANGGRGGNLMGSGADALASTANFLSQKGWSRGAGWDEGQSNFSVLLQWNNSPVYAKTVAAFADELARSQ